jgi:hypothetical protein
MVRLLGDLACGPETGFREISSKRTSGAALEDCTFPSGVDSAAVLLRVIKSSCSPAPRATVWSAPTPAS